MLLFFDSFDHYTEGRLTDKWNTKFGLTVPFGGGPTVTAAAARVGQGLRLGLGAQCTKSLPDTQTFICGFALKIENTLGDRRICYVRDEATIQLYLRISATGKIFVHQGNGTVLGISSRSLTVGKWNYIEFKATISHTVGSFELRINRTFQGSGTLLDTQLSTNQYMNNFGFGEATISTSYINVDDLYICDTTGTRNNNFLGIQAADAVFPRANGLYSEWNLFGAGSAFSAVNEHTSDADTSYRYRNDGLALADVFFFDPVRETPGGVAGVAYSVHARKLYGNNTSFTPYTRPGTFDGASGGTNYTGDRLYLETEYAYHQYLMEMNPAAGTWTAKAINATQFGVK